RERQRVPTVELAIQIRHREIGPEDGRAERHYLTIPSCGAACASARTRRGQAGMLVDMRRLVRPRRVHTGDPILSEKSLYERLGGVFAIAAVVDHFSDAVVQNPSVGKTSKNEALREWHTKSLGRLPGLKFMRTLWVCNVAAGPFPYTPTKAG